MGRYFDGASANYLLGTDYAPTDIMAPITVFAWVRQDDITVERTIVGKHDASAARHYILRTNGADRNGFFVVDAAGGGTGKEAFNDTGSIRAQRWYPATARITAAAGGEVSVWAAGKKGSSLDLLNNMHGTNSGAAMYIGRRSAAFGNNMKGVIAHLAFWNVGLSDREIVELSNGADPLSIKRLNLVSYFPLDRGGATEPDIIGGGTVAVQGSVPMAEGPTLPRIYIPTLLRNPTNVTVNEDQATVYLKITPSSTDIQAGVTVGTVYLDLQASGVENYIRFDAATIYLDLQVLGGECYSRFHFTGEGEADLRWSTESDLCRWSGDDQMRWTSIIEAQPGC